MNKNPKSHRGFVHLYNPKEEGLGAYDTNYINACKKNRGIKKPLNKINKERYVS